MKQLFIALVLVCASVSFTFGQQQSPSELKIEKSKAVILKEVQTIIKAVDTSQVRNMANKLREVADETSAPLYDQAYMLDNYADSLGIDMPQLDSINATLEDMITDPATSGDDQAVISEDGTGGFNMEEFTKTQEAKERKPKVAITISYGFVGAIAGKAAVESLRPTYQFGTGYHYEVNYSMRKLYKIAGDKKYYGRFGLSYDYHNLEQKTYFRFRKVDGKAVPSNINPVNTDDADLNFYSINVPISFDVKFKKGNMVCVGPYVGYVFGLNQTYSYKDAEASYQNKVIGDFGANRLRYGLKLEYMTPKFLGFYFQLDANNLTKGKAATANMFTVGIVLGR